MIPKRAMYAPPMMGLGIVATSAPSFPIMLMMMSRTAPVRTTHREATPVRPIGAEGLNCMLAGLFGAVGTTSYTENIGLIGLTGVASRWVVRTGAILLIVLSMVGKLGSLIATVPSPVIGGAYIALFGTIGALGIQVLMRADMGSQRNVLIVGFAFLMALGLPGWIEQNQELFMSTDYSQFMQTVGGMVWALLKTPMAVAGIIAALCDSLVPGTDEERGIGVKMK